MVLIRSIRQSLIQAYIVAGELLSCQLALGMRAILSLPRKFSYETLRAGAAIACYYLRTPDAFFVTKRELSQILCLNSTFKLFGVFKNSTSVLSYIRRAKDLKLSFPSIRIISVYLIHGEPLISLSSYVREFAKAITKRQQHKQ